MKNTTLISPAKPLAILLSMALSNSVFSQNLSNEEDTTEKIRVTGSYIKRSAAIAAEPVQVLDRSFIQSSGATTVSELIGKLAISSGAENQADSFTQASTQGTGNVNLRGLGLSSTLVLINGKRQTISGALTNDGSVFVDTSHIPVDAIERIEVLKEGAASVYGSDAVAGVVNFILRKDFVGFEASASFSKVSSGGQKDKDLGFLWGGEFGDTYITVSGHYLDRTPLSVAERPELADNAISSLGNSFLLFSASPVTVDSGAYAGTYNPFENVADPTCLDDELGVLIPQANGTRCGFNYGPIFNLVNTETRTQLYSNLNHDFDNGTGLFVELGWSSNDVKDNPQSPSYPDLTFPFIGAEHTGNPFGVGVVWLGRPLGAAFEPALAERENDTLRASININGYFDNNFAWNTALTYSKNNYKQFQQDNISSRLRAALAGFGGPNNDELFDPFNRGSTSQSVIEDFTHLTESEKSTDLLVFDAIFDGLLTELDTGDVGFAFGLQARHESFAVETDDIHEIKFDEEGNPIPVDLIFLGGLSEVDVSKSSFALFAESVIPITENLELKAALRYENLETDSSINPKIAVRWNMSEKVILRASASTAFREPSLSQLNASAVTLNGIQDFNADGTPKGGIAFIRVAANGNSELKPEESNNFNLGFIFKPNKNIDFIVDYWRVDYSDLITVENAQGKIVQDLNGPDIVRDSFGNLSGINVDFFNSSEVNVEGIDIESTWKIDEQWFASFNASKFLSYELTNSDGSTIEAAGFFNHDNFARSIPELKANFNLSWVSDNQRASLNVNYVSSYETTQAVPITESQNISSFTTVDGQYSATLFATDVSEIIVSLGVKNLFDKLPPRVYNGANLSYDPKQHNPLGRVYYAKLKYAF